MSAHDSPSMHNVYEPLGNYIHGVCVENCTYHYDIIYTYKHRGMYIKRVGKYPCGCNQTTSNDIVNK